jgi:hypothetical protein
MRRLRVRDVWVRVERALIRGRGREGDGSGGGVLGCILR